MFCYQFILGLSILTITLTNPITDEPEPCCFAKQFSSKRITSSKSLLPDGTYHLSYVLIDFHIDKER